MMRWLTDPQLFNRVILVLFALAAIRWALAKNWPQCGYWASAFVLNLCVTEMGGNS